MGNVIMKAQQIAYGASNVEAALDNLNVAELIELDKRMAAIDEWKANVHEVTYTGPELTINNALAVPARSLKTTIEAIQDLHGYDHPWAGGAGRNKFDGTYQPYYISGGGSNQYSYDVNCMSVVIPIVGGNKYTISMSGGNRLIVGTTTTAPSAGDMVSVLASYYDNIPEHITVTTDASAAYLIAYVSTSQTTVQTMVEVGETAHPYEPYANICPISGRTEARVDTENEDSSESAYAVIQLGQTVYGADINWDTGVCTPVDTRYDLGNITYSYHPTLHYFYGNLPSDAASPISGGCDGISSIYKVVQTARPNDGELAMLNTSFGNNKTIWINDSRYTDPTEFKTAVTGQTVTYPFAEPTPIQLTPSQLELLKGYNRVSVSGGYATIELKALVLGGDD